MGSTPSALGRLANLDWLGLDGNALNGPIPAELGNLTNLRGVTLSDNFLSGPLPTSLTRLSVLGRLNIDGTGLCVPDAPAMQAWVAALSDFRGAVCVGSVAFSRVVTQSGLGLFDSVVGVADLDGDGRDDVLAAKYLEYNVAREERLTKTPLRLFVSVGDGSFRYAPELVGGTIDVRTPIVVGDDFNGDGRADLAVFDAGVYVVEQSVGVGNPPQLFLSGPDGRLRPSDALADAVRREHALRTLTGITLPRPRRAKQRKRGCAFGGVGKSISITVLRPHLRSSGPADLHLKSATAGDIDGDGDIDLWVESTGGVRPHD